MKQLNKYKLALVYIFTLIGIAATCQSKTISGNERDAIQSPSVAIAAGLLSLSDAEKIMGEPAKLTGNTFVKKGDTLEYKCDYTSLVRDTETGKTGKLYFMYEKYGSVAAAASAYAAIYQANSRHEGAKVVTDLGNEAYYHSDGKGFYFVLVRKGREMVRLKLNKVNHHASEAAFKEVTRAIIDKL